MPSDLWVFPKDVPAPELRCGVKVLSLESAVVMGILNITPDSFFDGGRLYSQGGVELAAILRCAERMVAEGAMLLDVGGESTRPGAQAVSLQQELDRVVTVVEAISSRIDTIVSVDTSKGAVMTACAAAGAGLINDVRALRAPGALKAAVATGLPVCLMHMQGEPAAMQRSPVYDDVVAEVARFLHHQANQCMAAGVPRDQILIDPGFGFGKTLRHNLLLMRGLPELVAMGFPVLIGVSRKSMVGAVTGRPVAGRLPGSLALASLAALQGVAVIRTHDVAETRDAVAMMNAVKKE